MDNVRILELIASIITIWGIIEISLILRRGMIICIFGQLLWISYACINGMWFFLISSIVILVIDILGFINWTFKGVGYK